MYQYRIDVIAYVGHVLNSRWKKYVRPRTTVVNAACMTYEWLSFTNCRLH